MTATIMRGPAAPIVATFRVRQRTAATWDVVREIAGPDVLSVEEAPLRIGDLHRDPAAANAAAVAAADAWDRTGRSKAVARLFEVVITGRRPGQSYDLLPSRDPNADLLLGFVDLGIIARAA